MLIVGINAYHADASAAAIVDGSLVAAAEEERFCRVKHVAGFPAEALRYVIEVADLSRGEPLHLAVARDPWARLGRKAWYALRLPHWARARVGVLGRFAAIAADAAGALDTDPAAVRVHRVEHHKAHLASSFFVSPFDEAALFSIDGLGDFASTMWAVGRATASNPLARLPFRIRLAFSTPRLRSFSAFPSTATSTR